ncbi:MAG: Ig-like domain-containing protein [Gemmatimonadales bacterium]
MLFRRPVAAFTASLCAVLAISCDEGQPDISGPDPVASLALSPVAATIEVGQTLQLTLVLRDARRDILTDRSVTWTTSEPEIAVVSSSGLVTGSRQGSAGITATAEGLSATTRVTVQTSVAGVEITPASPTISVGTSVQLHANPVGSAGNPLDDRVAYWSTSNPRIAPVSVGKVRGARPGSAEISARVDDKIGTTIVTVVPAISGQWFLSETLSDAALGISCTGEGPMTLRQSGGSLSGTRVRTGSCETPAGALDHSGSFEIAEGFLIESRLDFEWHGARGCAYVGELVGTPAASASGAVSCVSEFDGTPVRLQGSWEMRR